MFMRGTSKASDRCMHTCLLQGRVEHSITLLLFLTPLHEACQFVLHALSFTLDLQSFLESCHNGDSIRTAAEVED